MEDWIHAYDHLEGRCLNCTVKLIIPGALECGPCIFLRLEAARTGGQLRALCLEGRINRRWQILLMRSE